MLSPVARPDLVKVPGLRVPRRVVPVAVRRVRDLLDWSMQWCECDCVRPCGTAYRGAGTFREKAPSSLVVQESLRQYQALLYSLSGCELLPKLVASTYLVHGGRSRGRKVHSGGSRQHFCLMPA